MRTKDHTDGRNRDTPTGDASSGDRGDPARERPRIPLATIFLVAAMSIPNLDIFWRRHGSRFALKLLANRYERTVLGDVWRPFTSWIPHADVEHLIWDLAYLGFAGFLFERTFGYAAWQLLLVFLAANAAGSWLSVLCDTRFDGVVGSSAGTHALVAYLCVRESLSRDSSRALRALCLVTLPYLAYLTAHGLLFGTMGWPLGFFPNNGYDHLGGISLAIAFGVVGALHSRRRNSRGSGPARCAKAR